MFMTSFGIKIPKLFLILAFIFAGFQAIPAFAQQNSTKETNYSTQRSSSMNLSFGLNEVLGGIYYNDPLGVQLATGLLPYEGVIDPETYRLGPNDLLSIEIESSQPMFLRGIHVNPQGDLVLPLIGSVNVYNLTILQAQEKLTQEFSKQVNNPKVNLSVESPRPTIVHIAGEVKQPGKYILPAQTRVDQAIFQVLAEDEEEVDTTGLNTFNLLQKEDTEIELAFRDVKLFHQDGTETNADLITYFRTGDLSNNPILKDGDLIVINRLNRETPKVSISGAVKSGIEVAFKKGDTPSMMLNLGGGFKEIADVSTLYVYRRSVTGVEKIEIPESEWNSFQLMPNDRVIAPYSEDFDASASAWIRGEVKIPGNFPIVSGQTNAFELLELSGGLTANALPKAAYLVRTEQKNGIPNQFNADLMKRTSDQVVEGLDYLDTETQLSGNRVFIDLTDNEQLKNLKIFDDDQLFIPKDDQTIFVFGQVNNPGYFGYSSTKSVNEYISQAGGFALSANKDRVFVLKAGDATWFKVGDTDLNSGDKIFVDREPIEKLNEKRQYEIQRHQLRNQRTQLVMAAITTITGIITTYVALKRLN